MPVPNETAYIGPLTKAELAECNAQRTGSWVIGAGGAMRQPLTAEARTDGGPEQRRAWPLWILTPLYCAAVVGFFTLGWFIFALPSGDTARILALLIGAPLALIVAAALLARWLH